MVAVVPEIIADRPVEGKDVLVDVSARLSHVDAANEDAVADVGDVGEEDGHEGSVGDRRRGVLQVARHVCPGRYSGDSGEENRKDGEESFTIVARPQVCHRRVPVVARETLGSLVWVRVEEAASDEIYLAADEENQKKFLHLVNGDEP